MLNCKYVTFSSTAGYILIVLQENWKKYSRGFLRDWAEGKHDDDPFEYYPFPVPPVRDDTPSTDNKESLPTDQQEVGNISRPRRLWQLVKVLTASPPCATEEQIKGAIKKFNTHSNERNTTYAANKVVTSSVRMYKNA